MLWRNCYDIFVHLQKANYQSQIAELKQNYDDEKEEVCVRMCVHAQVYVSECVYFGRV